MAIGHSWAFFTDDQVVHMSCALYFSRFQVVGGIYAGMGFWDLNRKWYIYIIHTPWITALLIRHLASTVVRCFRSRGGFSLSGNIISEFWPDISQNSANILPTCNRKVAISYLQTCGVFARSVTCGGAVGKLRFLVCTYHQLRDFCSINWYRGFFWVLLPRKFNMVHMKMDQNGKGFHSGFGNHLFQVPCEFLRG